MKTMEKEILESEARYLRMSLPYDEDEHLISFDDGVMTELECDENFTPPMLNADTKMLDFIVDLKERRVLDWNYEDGYLRMWAKVCDGGTYTLLDKDKKPIWQIRPLKIGLKLPTFLTSLKMGIAPNPSARTNGIVQRALSPILKARTLVRMNSTG